MKRDLALRRFEVILRSAIPSSEELEVVQLLAPTRQSAWQQAALLYPGLVAGVIAIDND